MTIPEGLRQWTPKRVRLGQQRGTLKVTTRHRLRRLRGYTLLELVIVLAIIGVLAAVSMPALMRPWSRSQVQQAAQDLSRDLLKARLNAIQHGTAYQFRWREKTGEYEIVAWQAAPRPATEQLEEEWNSDEAVERSEPSPLVQDRRDAQEVPLDRRDLAKHAPDATRRWRIDGRLVNDVVFLPVAPPVLAPPDRRPLQAPDRQLPAPPTRPARLSSREGLPPQQTESYQPWTEPIWFFPDGRTSTADMVLRDAEGHSIRLSLRGMTGTIRVGVVKKVETMTATSRSPMDTTATVR